MIPENRENDERTDRDGGNYNAEQAIMSYLRQHASPEALSNGEIFETEVNMCAAVARVFDERRGRRPPVGGYPAMAEKVVRRYMHNWEGKEPGTDDRGHRLGKGNPAK